MCTGKHSEAKKGKVHSTDNNISSWNKIGPRYYFIQWEYGGSLKMCLVSFSETTTADGVNRYEV